MNAYQLKISVKNSKPLRWRRCIIPAGITYSQLSLLLSSLMEERKKRRPVPLKEPVHKVITPILIRRDTTD